MKCLRRVPPPSFWFSTLEKSRFQLMAMSATQAPMRPKIPPEAPTLMYSGRKMAERMFPPTALMKKTRKAATQPWACSMADPMNHRASILSR